MAGEAASGAPGAAPNQGQIAADNVTNKVMGQPPADAGLDTTGTNAGNPASDAAKEAMRKFKVKVDNQDLEVDESELIKGYTHGKAAAKRFQEGSKAKQQAEQFIALMKDKGSLFDTIKKLGHDPRALAEEYLAAQIQDELMDPKDKELKTYRQKVEAYEKAEKQRLEKIQQEEHEKLKGKFAKEFEAQFIDALKQSGLPQTKPMVAEMAKYIKRAADIGYQLNPADAAKLVREDEESRLKSVVGETDAEMLVKILGEDTLQKLRTYEAQRLRNPNSGLTTPTEQGEEVRKRDNSERMTPKQWREFNRK